MNYPTRILPQLHYKRIIDFSSLVNAYLIRATETNDNKNANGKLKADCITRQLDHLRDYSNVLLGHFEIEDIFIELLNGNLKPYFVAEWIEGQELEHVPVFDNDYKINTDKGYFFLSIKDCNGHEVEYDDESEVIAVCKLLHTPTNSNFWHISLRWFHNGQDTIEMSKSARRRILTAAKSFIQEKGTFDTPIIEKPDSSLFS